jgi:early secretory antigenic target protein ESAT-6
VTVAGPDQISVTSHELLALVADARAAVSQIDQTLGELDDRVAALRAGFSGEASDAYDAAQREWRVTAQQMRDSLDAFRVGLTNAHGHYGAAETSAVRTWS